MDVVEEVVGEVAVAVAVRQTRTQVKEASFSAGSARALLESDRTITCDPHPDR